MGTAHYQFKQWEDWERPGRAGLNSNFAALDAAVFDKADKAATAAQLTALDGRLEAVVGSYTGDGAESRTISLGFPPQAVLVEDSSSVRITSMNSVLGGLALQGLPCGYTENAVEIVTNGFRVAFSLTAGSGQTNAQDSVYRYIAFR